MSRIADPTPFSVLNPWGLLFHLLWSNEKNICTSTNSGCVLAKENSHVHVCKFLCNTANEKHPAPPKMYKPVKHGLHYQPQLSQLVQDYFTSTILQACKRSKIHTATVVLHRIFCRVACTCHGIDGIAAVMFHTPKWTGGLGLECKICVIKTASKVPLDGTC